MAPSITEQVTTLERMLGEGLDIGSQDATVIQDSLLKARGLIADISQHVAETRDQLGLERWAKLVQMFQNLAFIEPDNGAETEISSWCERQWAEILQEHSHNVAAMRGLGHCWLLKAQPTLARIYALEGSPSSSEGSRRNHRLGVCRTWPTPDEAEDTTRINSPDYVEARSLLRPALENLDRAVTEAELQGSTTGRMLEICAEAYVSFGNVSHPRNNEVAYQKALRLLRTASTMRDHVMDSYLQEFLEDNVDYIQ